MKKRYFRLFFQSTVVSVALLLASCGGSEEQPVESMETGSEPVVQAAIPQPGSEPMGEYADGFYFAEENGFNEQTGWKYIVLIEVEDGRITSATWEGASRDGGTTKTERSRNGEYGMVEYGGAIAPWVEQAQAAQAHLLETQDPTEISYTDAEGRTDAISGATIHVVEYFSLAERALRGEPTGYGMWQDGVYTAQNEGFADGWRSQIGITVVGGRIVAANWDATAEDGGSNKKQRSIDGEYGMTNAGAIAPWYEQAYAIEDYLIAQQDPAQITVGDDGTVDAVSGASIRVSDFVTLAAQALEGARR